MQNEDLGPIRLSSVLVGDRAAVGTHLQKARACIVYLYQRLLWSALCFLWFCFETSPNRELKQPGRGHPSLFQHLLPLHRNLTSQNRPRINSSRHNMLFPTLIISGLVFPSCKVTWGVYSLLTVLHHSTIFSQQSSLFSLKISEILITMCPKVWDLFLLKKKKKIQGECTK